MSDIDPTEDPEAWKGRLPFVPPEGWELEPTTTTIVSQSACVNPVCPQYDIVYPNYDPAFVGVEVHCGACTLLVEERPGLFEDGA